MNHDTNEIKINDATRTVKGVRRAFADTRAGIGNKFLHYETVNDERGRGTSLDMADIRCWETSWEPTGANIEL